MSYPKHPGIYAIRHIESGKAYIGSAKNIYSRWRSHKSDLRLGRHSCQYLQHAWNKYGEAAFVFEVLEVCLPDIVALRSREESWLQRLGGRLYNSSLFAEAATGKPWTEEQKATVRAKMMGNKNGEGTHYHGKLTESDIVDILYRYARGEPTKDIATLHDVTTATVCRAVKRKIWWRVQVPQEINDACLARVRARGYHIVGEAAPKAKLNQDKAEEIRRRAANGEAIKALSEEFGVTYAAIRFVVIGRTWCRKPIDYIQVDLPEPSSRPPSSPILNRRKYRANPRPDSKPRPARITVHCESCGTPLSLPPCKIRKHKSHYCGKDCRREGARRRALKMMEDPERREHLAEVNRGKKASSETRAKMSESQRRRQAKPEAHPVRPNAPKSSGPRPAQ